MVSRESRYFRECHIKAALGSDDERVTCRAASGSAFQSAKSCDHDCSQYSSSKHKISEHAHLSKMRSKAREVRISPVDETLERGCVCVCVSVCVCVCVWPGVNQRNFTHPSGKEQD